METMMAIVIGILFSIGIYLLLCQSLLRIILGISIISHATNLLIITMGGLKTGGPPLISDGFPIQTAAKLILTAIIINFALTAFLLVLAYRSCSTSTENMEQLRGNDDE